MIQVRRDTAANWTTADALLAQGEIGYETDTNKIKVGDGVTLWTSLGYFGGDPTLVTYENLSANGDIGTGADQVAQGDHLHTGVYEPADANIAKVNEANSWTGIQNFTTEIQVNSSAGSSGQVLTSQGSGVDPVWATPPATGASLSTTQTWTAAQRGSTQTASVSGTVTLDFNTYQHFVLTLTGNVTLANPTTESVGQVGVITFVQGGSGSYTVSSASQYKTPGGLGVTVQSTVSSVSVIPYKVRSTDNILLGSAQVNFL